MQNLVGDTLSMMQAFVYIALVIMALLTLALMPAYESPASTGHIVNGRAEWIQLLNQNP